MSEDTATFFGLDIHKDSISVAECLAWNAEFQARMASTLSGFSSLPESCELKMRNKRNDPRKEEDQD